MVVLLLMGAVILPPRSGQAGPASGSENVERARQHFLAGKHAFETQAFAKALHEFEAGYALEPRPGFLLNMGHAARRLGQLRDARNYYQKFLATRPAPATSEQRVATELIAEIERELPPESPARAPAAATTPPAASGERPASRSPTRAAPAVDLRASPTAPGPEAMPDVAQGSGRLLTATAAPTPARGAGGAPLYRRWWFWAGLGAVAAGVATAIVIGSRNGGSPARDSGSWGQVQL